MAKSQNLAVEAYEYIKQMILRLEIKSGQKIPEQAIAERIGLSRTPIREALRLLSNSGLVVIQPKRYAQVITFTKEIVYELGAMRLTLDTLAARLAIRKGGNVDFDELKKIAVLCYEAAMANDVYHRVQYDCDFHLKLTEIAENRLLLKTQQDLYLKVQLLQTLCYTGIPSDLGMIEGHTEIVNALFERDTERVLKAVKDHIVKFYGFNDNFEIPDKMPYILNRAFINNS